MGFLISFVKNDEMCDERKESKSTQFLKGTLVICSSAFWKQKCENLKNISLTFFKF